MVFDMVIYVTLINLTEMECILLLLKSGLFLCIFVIFHFGQIKMIFRGDESLKKYLFEMSMFVDIVTK